MRRVGWRSRGHAPASFVEPSGPRQPDTDKSAENPTTPSLDNPYSADHEHLPDMTASMRAISADAGYKYLLRTVAAADGDRELSTPLTRYYVEEGTLWSCNSSAVLNGLILRFQPNDPVWLSAPGDPLRVCATSFSNHMAALDSCEYSC